MAPKLGTGNAPVNIPNPNLPSKDAASSAGSKAPSVAGSSIVNKKGDDSAAALAQDDPARAIEKLEIRTKAVNSNNIARVANSQLTSSDEKLHVLVSLKTGKPLDKFPITSKGIEKLSLVNIDQMLTGLEADRSGNEAAKRERLRVQIGLKPNPA